MSQTLLSREVRRFMRVWTQTLLAPSSPRRSTSRSSGTAWAAAYGRWRAFPASISYSPLDPARRHHRRLRHTSWSLFEQYSHEPNVATPRFWITHHVEMAEERRLSLETKRQLGYDALGVMGRHLTNNDYFVAHRYTVADISLHAYTHVANEGGFDLEGFPAVRAWLDRVAAQPGYVPITRG